MKSFFTIVAISVFLLSGCGVQKYDQNYQIIEDDDGRVYKLDRTTGELFLAEGGEMKSVSSKPPLPDTKPSTHPDASADRIMVETAPLQEAAPGYTDVYTMEDYSALEEAKDLGKKQMPGKELWCDLKTSWREGSLFFVFEVYPASSLTRLYETKLANYAEFRVSLVDENEFVVKEMRIPLVSMLDERDDMGQVVKVILSANFPFSAETYKDIVNYSVWWRLSSALIPNQE